MSAHTAGPWRSLESLVYFANNAGGFDLRGCPDAEANARLCSAAPELLAALQETHEQAMRWIYDACGMDGLAEEWSINARAAIAKATGGKP